MLGDVVARQVGVEVAEAEDVRGEVLRVGVLLDQEAKRALRTRGAVLEGPPVRHHELGRAALEPLLLDERKRLGRGARVADNDLGPYVELPAERGERTVEVRALLGEGGRIGEDVAPLRAVARPLGERRGDLGRLAVGSARGVVRAEALERLTAAEGRDVTEPARITRLPALQPLERQLVEVVTGRVLRGGEAVGVVVEVPGEVGDDLEQVLVGGEGTGRITGPGRRREEKAQ